MNRFPTNRRTLLLAALTAAPLAAFGPAAHAADPFPAKPVTIVTAFAPGSGPDAVLRIVAEKLGINVPNVVAAAKRVLG